MGYSLGIAMLLPGDSARLRWRRDMRAIAWAIVNTVQQK
jgi:hypothetical protein